MRVLARFTHAESVTFLAYLYRNVPYVRGHGEEDKGMDGDNEAPSDYLLEMENIEKIQVYVKKCLIFALIQRR